MRAPGPCEGVGFFEGLCLLAQLSFSGQSHQVQLLFQCDLIYLRVKALVEAARIQIGEAPLGLHHYLQRHLVIGLFLHDMVAQDELVLVLQDADLHSELHWHTGFAFADPLRVGLKDGEHPVFMRDHFTLDDAAHKLVDLTIRMLHEAFNLKLARNMQYVGKSRALQPHERL